MRAGFIFFVRLYQRLISSLLPPACRYYPTCSSYAIEALQRHGIAVGLLITIRRLLRCNPLSAGGYDPVSLKQTPRPPVQREGTTPPCGHPSIDVNHSPSKEGWQAEPDGVV